MQAVRKFWKLGWKNAGFRRKNAIFYPENCGKREFWPKCLVYGIIPQYYSLCKIWAESNALKLEKVRFAILEISRYCRCWLCKANFCRNLCLILKCEHVAGNCLWSPHASVGSAAAAHLCALPAKTSPMAPDTVRISEFWKTAVPGLVNEESSHKKSWTLETLPCTCFTSQNLEISRFKKICLKSKMAFGHTGCPINIVAPLRSHKMGSLWALYSTFLVSLAEMRNIAKIWKFSVTWIFWWLTQRFRAISTIFDIWRTFSQISRFCPTFHTSQFSCCISRNPARKSNSMTSTVEILDQKLLKSLGSRKKSPILGRKIDIKENRSIMGVWRWKFQGGYRILRQIVWADKNWGVAPANFEIWQPRVQLTINFFSSSMEKSVKSRPITVKFWHNITRDTNLHEQSLISSHQQPLVYEPPICLSISSKKRLSPGSSYWRPPFFIADSGFSWSISS
jgi:hypothetical protein